MNRRSFLKGSLAAGAFPFLPGCLAFGRDKVRLACVGLGTAADPEAGFALALDAAERGHVPAQTLVGECYHEAIGVAQDEARALLWVRMAAKQGNARALRLLREW